MGRAALHLVSAVIAGPQGTLKANAPMNLRKLLAGMIILVFLVAACSPPPPLRDATMLADDSLVTSDEGCSAPCWRGIIPGETAWRDALTIIEDDDSLRNMETRSEENSQAVVAEWQQLDGGACCQMVSLDGETVNLVFLRLAPNLTVGQLIARNGVPAYVLGTPISDDQAIINLVYPELKTIIYTFVAGITGMLSADSEIIGVLYVTPEDMELLLKTSNLNVWEGYETYQYYDEGEFEITPSVTLTPTASQ